MQAFSCWLAFMTEVSIIGFAMHHERVKNIQQKNVYLFLKEHDAFISQHFN